MSTTERAEVAEREPQENATLDRAAVRTTVEGRMRVRRPLRATYRLQFRPEFGFAAVDAIVGYLDQLGVSHIYASPLLKARRGTEHGYDVVDHSHLNDELGTEPAYVQLIDNLHSRGLGLILDVVPNHMSVGTDENGWWLDVLMHGPASRYANYFDIDWQPVQRELEHKLLLPILGELSGRLLEAGQLVVVLELGALFLRCQNLLLPLDPRTWTQVLAPGVEELAGSVGSEHPHVLELQSIINALQHLPERTESGAERVAERHRETLVARNRLRLLIQESPQVAAHVAENLERLNGRAGVPQSFDRLDRLLGDQAYQLVHWKAGADEMNFRRFFDVTELAAICMENPAVFDESHRLLFELAARGDIDGFRIDHIDGLYNPQEYLDRLQSEYVRALVRGAVPAARDAQLPANDELELARYLPTRGSGAALTRSERRELPLYVVVEKILGADEPLPHEWPVQGTTGYDFLNVLNGLFLDERGVKLLERHYVRFTEQRLDRRETSFQSKRLIIDSAMQSELQLLAHRLHRLSKRHRLSRDYTLQALRAALREIIASFEVYRTYVDGLEVSERDRRVVQRAVALARRRNPAIDAGVFDFVRGVLLLEQPAGLDEAGQAERHLFIGRMQQVTSPVMAKGMEDTTFYRYVPLLSINEVGSEPEHPLTSVEEFHRQNAWRQEHWPLSMLATTTHDTKRSEDVRARLNVLSEVPGLWRQAVQRWTRWNRPHRVEVDGEQAPSRNDEWLFYQTLLGIWPLHPPSEAERATLIERLQQYMEKAVHEAKLRTSWINPSPQYDAAVHDFVAKSLSAASSRFIDDVATFVKAGIESGLYTALAQLLLKLTSPGTPDIYQGQELWDFSLVDPDNRRPVDYERRTALLTELQQRADQDDARRAFCRALAEQPRDDRIKLLVTATALQFRRRWPDLAGSRYVALSTRGSRAEHVCAFAWLSPDSASPEIAIVVAPRLIHSLTDGCASRMPCGAEIWGDTAVSVEELPDVELRDEFTGRRLRAAEGWLPVASLLEDFPVALATSAAKQPE